LLRADTFALYAILALCRNDQSIYPMKNYLLCLILLCATHAVHADEILAEDGRSLTRAEILAELARSDFILLGELHDNPHHHDARGALIRDLAARKPTIVMEFLDRGTRLDPAKPLLEEMERAGFSAKGWRWPLHEPLFAAARDTGLAILGGNLRSEDARRVAKEGEKALAPEIAAQLVLAPLSESAQKKLDDDLNAGHCGHLSTARLPNMRLAQRARDTAMATAMLAERDGPVILLAGNGHARRDYGVGSQLRLLAPQRRIVSIGFFESGPGLEKRLAHREGAFDFVWITPPAQRDDPCAGFRFTSPPPTR
jgi:uncharacterized iron-regulated protein